MTGLVIRMSSLGDVILSTAFLENLPEGVKVDWVISREFEFVLRGHPRIRRLLPFDKRSGFSGWIRFCRGLMKERYDFRVDLHRTLRSRLAFFLLGAADLLAFNLTPTFAVSKQRWRTLILLGLKNRCPAFLLPEPYWRRFARLGTRISSPPSQAAELRPPSWTGLLPSEGEERSVLERFELQRKAYVAVMPASRWSTKEWETGRYVEVLQALHRDRGLIPLILGRRGDGACVRLLQELRNRGIPFRETLEEQEFKVTAVLLKHAAFYLGSDTGLAHLAEAVGTGSRVIFGPTRPSLGFGPWREESRSISLPLSCAPCSKDGRRCLRVTSPYHCLRKLSAETVLKELS